MSGTLARSRAGGGRPPWAPPATWEICVYFCGQQGATEGFTAGEKQNRFYFWQLRMEELGGQRGRGWVRFFQGGGREEAVGLEAVWDW